VARFHLSHCKFILPSNKQIYVSFSYVCPVIDHECYQNIVNLSSCGSTDCFDNVMMNIIGKNSTHMKNWLQFVFDNKKLSNCLLSPVDTSHKWLVHLSVHLLTMKISQWASKNFCSCRIIHSFALSYLLQHLHHHNW